MAKLTIDGKEVIIEEGKTILDAARQHGIRIPTICNHPAVSSWGGCRMCVVEVDGSPRLAAACVMPVRDGMKVVTTNENIITARRTVLEFLFPERNHYCMFCGASGDCELQTLAYDYQMDHLTVTQSFDKFPMDVTNLHDDARRTSSPLSIVTSTHDLRFAATVCAWLVLLAEGRVVAMGTPAQVLTPETLSSVYGLTRETAAMLIPGRGYR